MRGCPICRSANRKGIDAMLASDRYSSPQRVSRMLVGFSRRQVRHHRNHCLAGLLRIMFSILHDNHTEVDVVRKLEEEGKTREAIEFILATVRRLLEKAVVA
jgi:hypothetical protein